MAKRFTDTGKWANVWFSDLPPRMKLVWIYLCDNCDHAGVWEINMKLMQFQLGERIELQEILSAMGNKVLLADDGKKLFLPPFLDFQYGALNPDNRVHQSVLQRLDRIGLLAILKPLISPFQGAKDKDKDKERISNLNTNTNSNSGNTRPGEAEIRAAADDLGLTPHMSSGFNEVAQRRSVFYRNPIPEGALGEMVCALASIRSLTSNPKKEGENA